MDPRDAPWEELLSKNPYSVKSWLGYLQHKAGAAPVQRYVIYERALLYLNRSYKIWRSYLQERGKLLSSKCISDKRYDQLIGVYDRCLLNLEKMPRLWLDYLALVMHLRRGTLARHIFNKAIQSLPITQHEALWDLYLPWVRDTFAVASVTQHIYERYLLFAPEHREGYIQYLIEQKQPGAAAQQLLKALADPNFTAPSGRTRHALTLQLCELLGSSPNTLPTNIDVSAVIRKAIAEYAAVDGGEVGRMWCRLADYYVRRGDFEHARTTYEEAITAVSTVRDFGVIFDAYVKVEESVITALMEQGDTEENADEDMESRLQLLEDLLERRPLLVNAVLLRQNPHNVSEWHKRVKLLPDSATVVNPAVETKDMCYRRALAAVDPSLATGRLASLHIAYARYLESFINSADEIGLERCREVWKTASTVNFKTVDELAQVYCGWAEFELRHQKYAAAREVMSVAVMEPRASAKRRRAAAEAQGRANAASATDAQQTQLSGASSADKLHRNLKVWALYLDLEESLGTPEMVRAAYERAIELKVISLQMCLNFASYLEEQQYYEEAFTVYERAIGLFPFVKATDGTSAGEVGNASKPSFSQTYANAVCKLWTTYIHKFVARYAGSKLERLRDLLEQAVGAAPSAQAVELYLLYAKLEETYGLPRHALAVYDRAVRAVLPEQRLDMYKLYISKVVAVHGLSAARPIYEHAVTVLDDNSTRELCLDFAQNEITLGEVDRARAIYQHASQFANPRRVPAYWTAWQAFEERYGNETTYRDMLRQQRTVETRYAQTSYAAEDAAKALSSRNDASADREGQSGLKRSFVKAGFSDIAGEDNEEEEQDMRDDIAGDTDEIDIEDDAVVMAHVPERVFSLNGR